jgi:hypothetical protein
VTINIDRLPWTADNIDLELNSRVLSVKGGQSRQKPASGKARHTVDSKCTLLVGPPHLARCVGKLRHAGHLQGDADILFRRIGACGLSGECSSQAAWTTFLQFRISDLSPVPGG